MMKTKTIYLFLAALLLCAAGLLTSGCATTGDEPPAMQYSFIKMADG